MFLAVHAAVGALAGNAVQHQTAALALGFISHFFLDMIPHGDEHMYEGYMSGKKRRRAVLYVLMDVALTTILVALFFLQHDFFNPRNAMLGIFGGLLPDFLVLFGILTAKKRQRWIYRKLDWFHRFHMRNHHFLIKRLRKFERDIPVKYGLLLQGVVLTALVKIVM